MKYYNKYVKCVNYKTNEKLIGIIDKGGYHHDFHVPKGYNVASAGWFTDAEDGEIITFGHSLGYCVSPDPEDSALIKAHICKLNY